MGFAVPQRTNLRKFPNKSLSKWGVHTKWVEAASYKAVTATAIKKFIRNNIVARYGVPHSLISDNGANFTAKRIEEYLQNLKIKHHRSSPYPPK